MVTSDLIKCFVKKWKIINYQYSFAKYILVNERIVFPFSDSDHQSILIDAKNKLHLEWQNTNIYNNFSDSLYHCSGTAVPQDDPVCTVVHFHSKIKKNSVICQSYKILYGDADA